MIGVIANPGEAGVVREFFELFKTPWEFFQESRDYEVVVCAGEGDTGQAAAKLLLLYAGRRTAFDAEHQVQVQPQPEGTQLSLQGRPFPICGNSVTFEGQGIGDFIEECSGKPVAQVERFAGRSRVRVGYDLFREVQILLTKGQAPEYAGVATLELHIAFLRNVITGFGVPLVEIPPVPAGYAFIGCLTHDVDFSAIRGYKFEPAMFGFLYRAILRSAMEAGRGRITLRHLVTNWTAAAKLPFVFLGLAKDFWSEFDLRYLEMEGGRPSTYFVIPIARRPGRLREGTAPRTRGCRYELAQFASKLPGLKAAGCEIGLHGIDAWLDSASGRMEAGRLSEITATTDLGVRMHWLYSDAKSALALEAGGFSYDSTVGYNGTVGYRAGTGQVFRPLETVRLLELPMQVMDTALFYPNHLNLSFKQAWEVVEPLLVNATRHGGVLTVNWHDRSVAPERLWGKFYQGLIEKMTARGAWFATAGQAVSWFRKRRAVLFEKTGTPDGEVSAKVEAESHASLPGLRLRVHNKHGYTDTNFNHGADFLFAT
jgi:hypothetical protein